MKQEKPERVYSWGRISKPGRELRSEDLLELAARTPLLRGLGRSYGDACLPPEGRLEVGATVLADRFLTFDEESGILRAEAGLSYREITRVLLPRGWAMPVFPGTQSLTLGGMVAADVHGKNHHVAGCVGAHITALRMLVADGRVLDCSREREPELFRATLGGMGLTGGIVEVELRLRRVPSPWILCESERCARAAELIACLREASAGWPFTVAWLDCLAGGRAHGRGIVLKGRWARPEEAPAGFPPPRPRIGVPFSPPNWLLNRFSLGLFNRLHYFRHLPRKRREIQHPEAFFFPLDAVDGWNRVYGSRGFIQYQCLLPDPRAERALSSFLGLLASLRAPVALAVLKDCGAEGEGMLSFPRPGLSLALDMARGPGLQAIVDRLNAFVIAEGGRIYLAKDAMTRPEHFRAMEPRLSAWQETRRAWGGTRFRSALSVRLLGDSA